MTPNAVTLTPPASPRRRRRGLGLAASIGAHGALIVLIVMPRSRPEPPRDPSPPPAQKLTWVVPVTAMPPPALVPPAPKGRPVAYATAPASLAQGRDWRDLLPRALALQAEGINAPSFVVENLDRQVINTLVARHLALVVAGRPPFDRDARQVLWTETGVVETVPLPTVWTQRVARRAIVLPREWTQGLTLAADEQVYLLITTDLDAAILAAQLAVAEQRGVALKALTRTHGRLLPAPGGLLAFHIDAVENAK